MMDTDRYCPYCGQALEPGDIYCAACGHVLAGQPASAPPPAQAERPPGRQPTVSAAAPVHPPLPPTPPPPPPQALRRPAPPDSPLSAAPARVSTAAVPLRSGRGRRFFACFLSAGLLALLAYFAFQYRDRIGRLLPAGREPPVPASGAVHSGVTALAFNTDDELPDRPPVNLLAAGTAAGAIYVFDVENATLVDSFTGLLRQDAPVSSIRLGPAYDYNETLGMGVYRHEYIAAAQPFSAGVLNWDLRLPRGKRLLTFVEVTNNLSGGPLLDVSFSPSDYSLWAFDVTTQSACQWDLSSGNLIYSEARPFELEQAQLLTRSINGRYSLLLYPAGELEVFDSWQATGGVTDYGLPVFRSGNCFSWPSEVLAVSSLGYLAAAGGVRDAWAVEVVAFPGAALHLRLPTPDRLTALAFSYHGDKLAGGGPGYLIIWDARTGSELQRLPLQ